MIRQSQSRRVVPARRRRGGWPWDEPESMTLNDIAESEAWVGRPWPCGSHDGGWLAGPVDECRAADVLLEDQCGPPPGSEVGVQAGSRIVVASTHTETALYGFREDGLRYGIHSHLPHPEGIR